MSLGNKQYHVPWFFNTGVVVVESIQHLPSLSGSLSADVASLEGLKGNDPAVL